MHQHVEILDQPETWRGPFMGAIALHGAVVLTIVGYSLMGVREQWGTQTPGGNAVTVQPVSNLPFPTRTGARNPLASESESQVPQTPVKEREREVERVPSPDAEALKLKREKKKPSEIAAAKQRFRPEKDLPPNQVYSQQPQAVSSQIFAAAPGTGTVGGGQGGSLGFRFGAYEQLLRQLIAQKWRTGDVDPNMKTAPIVIVRFDLYRDGNIRNVRILQQSGNRALDFSAQRAILEAAPFPPIPPGFERESAQVEFTFELRR